MFTLRDYQEDALTDLREGIRLGYRTQMLCSATGSGKTMIAGAMLESVRKNGKKAVFVADRRELVRQTSDRLHEAGVEHGVLMADETYGRLQPIQVCSAQTLEKRGTWPDLDLVLIDEAHTMRKQTLSLVNAINKPVIGLSASPLSKGLGKYYSRVVNVRSTKDLITDGWLVPVRTFAAKEIDMSGVPLRNGEWASDAVAERAIPITGDIVSEWVKKTNEIYNGPVKTLVFSSNVAHGSELCRQFNFLGYRFEQVSYRDTDDRKQAAIKAFREGKIQGLISAEMLVKGFDVPDALCLVDARPYRQLMPQIQKIGRVMRSSPGKTFGLVLDHCGNMSRHWDALHQFWAHGVDTLDESSLEKIRSVNRKERKELKCFQCGFMMPMGSNTCPYCGAQIVRKSKVIAKPGKMVELVNVLDQVSDLWPHISRLAYDRHPHDITRRNKFAWVQYRELTGKNAWGRPLLPNAECDPRIEKVVNRRMRAYFARRGR